MFLCDRCNEKFTRKDNRDRHIKIRCSGHPPTIQSTIITIENPRPKFVIKSSSLKKNQPKSGLDEHVTRNREEEQEVEFLGTLRNSHSSRVSFNIHIEHEREHDDVKIDTVESIENAPRTTNIQSSNVDELAEKVDFLIDENKKMIMIMFRVNIM